MSKVSSLVLKIDTLAGRAHSAIIRSMMKSRAIVTVTFTESDILEVLKSFVLELTFDDRCPYVASVYQELAVKTCVALGQKHGFDGDTLYQFLENYSPLSTHLDEVYEEISDWPYEMWTINDTRKGIYVLESMGDFRIEEWKRDHIVRGKYRKTPRR